MGISGLLPLLKSIHQPCNLKKFAGKTIGVDAYGWLHRGTVTCAIDLALGKPTTKFVDFAMNRVRMLIHFGITPYIVFDGDYLPSKAGTESDRAQRREESKKLGLELLKVGKTSQAHLELQKAVDVTPEMARQFIEELKFHNVQYVVAPYEADAQLAYMEKHAIIHGILSEDSDLLVFGAKCLITKLDKYGECVEINRNRFTACREISLVGWTDADFRRMAMLSGCDYLPGIGKMGLKTAHRMLRKHKSVERLVKAAQFDGQFKVPKGYIEAFDQAEKTFLYQWVFCPIKNELVHLTNLEPGLEASTMPFIGSHVVTDIATGVANGNLNPHTKVPMVVNAVDRSHSKPLRPNPKMANRTHNPAGKNARPIDTFFKPKRTPLAELDPNVFTPSPSQQVVLEQQQRSGSWAAVLAPEPASNPQGRPVNRRTASLGPSQLRSSGVRTARRLSPRRTVSASTALSSTGQQSPKRQRLCSDNSYVTSPSKSQGERSRFFAEPSPSARVLSKSKNKRRGSDFDLFSDDSFGEEMVTLADIAEAKSKPKKLTIFQDDFRSSVNSDSQPSIFSNGTPNDSQLSTGPFTPATSCGGRSPDSAEETVFSAALSSKVKDLRSRFSYNSGIAGKDSSPSSFPRPTQKSTLGQSKTSLVVEAETVHKSKQLESISEAKDTVELEDSAWAAMEAEIVVAASDAEVLASSPPQASPVRNIKVRGSEDLLAPDSEAESDASPHKPVFDLGRFAFQG